MDIKKFNEKMGRINYTKGGYIKKLGGRKYFDAGGIAQNVTPGGVGGPGNANTVSGSGIQGITNALGLAPQAANIQGGTNAAQINNAYTGANNAINAQVGLANTLNPQAANAVNNQNTVANEELAMTQGAGPNPAKNQLAQATGTNVANEAALLAGQRGASANPGLAARNAAVAGTTAQQGAAGQAATLEANQQIAAQQALTGLSGQQVNQAQGATTALNTAQQNEQGILQGANTSANNAAVTQQAGLNNINAQNNGKILGGITSGVSALSGGLFAEGGEVHPDKKHKLEFIHKMTKLGMEHFDRGGTATASPTPPPSSGISSYPAGQAADKPPIDPNKARQVSDSFKSVFADGGQIQANPLLSAITTPAGSQMPQAPGYNQASSSSGPQINTSMPSDSGPSLGDQMKSGFQAGQDWKANKPEAKMNAGLQDEENNFNNNYSAGPAQEVVAGGLGSDAYAKGGEIWKLQPHEHASYSANHFKNYFAKGGESKDVPAMVSPGEIYLDPDAVERVKHGADPLKEGMRIPGRAKVKGDSLKNDIVPATLKEGGVVIDKNHVGSSNKARLFTLKSLKASGKHLKRPGSMK